MGFGPKPSKVNVEAFLASPEVKAQQAARVAVWDAGISQMESDVERAELYIAAAEYGIAGLENIGNSIQPGMGDLLRAAVNSIKDAASHAADS